MVTKRTILEACTRTSLLEIAKGYEFTGVSGLPKSEIVDLLARKRLVQPDELLTNFSRDELKKMCQTIGIDDSGREKQILIDRLMGRDGQQQREQKTARGNTRQTMAKKKTNSNPEVNVEDYRHSGTKRKNNPPAKIAAEGVVPTMPKIKYSYSPRRPPVLRFDASGGSDRIPELIEKATKGPLSKDEAKTLSEALQVHQPWLEWTGKRESQLDGFSVDPVALHIHERVSAQAILKVAARQDVERTLFSDPEQEYHEAVQFYKHEIDWTNRLILGDSLQVMASLAHREDLAGQVQMIYMDPPYGIKYGSNFQPEIGRNKVEEKEKDLTREIETVKAYRDTWHLGLHSYLNYLRDRLVVCRELLSDSGSIFIQIGEENRHRVRTLLDEVFGESNFISEITYKTSVGLGSEMLDSVCNYLLWFAKDREKAEEKYRQLYKPLTLGLEGATRYSRGIDMATGEIRTLYESEKDEPESIPESVKPFTDQGLTSRTGSAATTFPVEFEGAIYRPTAGGWRTGKAGIERVIGSDRVIKAGKTIRFKKKFDDFGALALTNFWADVGGGIQSRLDPKVYAVQTATNIVERCLLMCTDPGDLVLDPTCGSGTTAFVAEKWGRRWITVDTSRVAVSVARQRLLSAAFDYFQLKLETSGVAGGFLCATVPHITLKSIAQNGNLDPLLQKHEKILQEHLTICNAALALTSMDLRHELERKLFDKQRKEGKRAISDADNRRWRLPKKGEKFEHWTVPFDTDPDWPKDLKHAVESYRKAWRTKMDELNECIAANASQEELVDQPKVVKGIVRVSGPFTVEAVQPPERSLGSIEGMFDGSPDELEDRFETKNVESYIDQMTRLLRLDGVRFPNNKELEFSRLQRLMGQTSGLHAEGRWVPKGEKDDDPEGQATVAIGFGPQYGPVTAKQVEDLIRSASRRGYDALIVAGFSFDGPAQAAIEESQHPKLRIHMANIRPDVNPGMAGLLKEQPGSQLFTVFGQPRTRLEGQAKRGEYVVHMEGVDIYDPVSNIIHSTEDSKVAAWFVDGDYDGRTFCITQAFFPDKSAWDKLAKALGGVVDEDAFEKLSGTESLPFPAGKHKCVAVKVIDPRGNEVMQVHHLG